MLKHIVMWRFKDGAEGKTALEHSAWMKQHLEALVGVVPELHSLEYGVDVLRSASSYDGVLTVTVDDLDALSRYTTPNPSKWWNMRSAWPKVASLSTSNAEPPPLVLFT